MQLFDTPTNASSTARLTEKYRPLSIDEFVGLDKPKRICKRIAANPQSMALLFVGEPGLGKTTLALALAEAIPAELHHIGSQECSLDRLKHVIGSCQYVPISGKKMHLVLIDEADQMTNSAQLHLLSKLDSTAAPPNTIFVFTCNSTQGLEERFTSRCLTVEFSNYGSATDTAAHLERVWSSEAPQDAKTPNFARIVKDTKGNVRAGLMSLQNELLLA